MFNYFKDSLKRKIARRITKEYPAVIENYTIKGFGQVQFANWSNPLIQPRQLSENMVTFLNQFIKEGDLAIDIGANSGDTTVPIALCAGATGLTIGFDPNPYVFSVLEINASLNRDKTNIVPVRCAISEKEEEFYFISSEASFGNGAISPVKDSKHGRYVYPEKIKGINLKKFLDENYREWLPKFSFLKVDTEGYDKEIIKSIRDLITACKPIIIAESFGNTSNANKMELYEVIAGMGYDIFYFADFDPNAEVKKLNSKEELAQWKHTVNIYALPHKG